MFIRSIFMVRTAVQKIYWISKGREYYCRRCSNRSIILRSVTDKHRHASVRSNSTFVITPLVSIYLLLHWRLQATTTDWNHCIIVMVISTGTGNQWLWPSDLHAIEMKWVSIDACSAFFTHYHRTILRLNDLRLSVQRWTECAACEIEIIRTANDKTETLKTDDV